MILKSTEYSTLWQARIIDSQEVQEAAAHYKHMPDTVAKRQFFPKEENDAQSVAKPPTYQQEQAVEG